MSFAPRLSNPDPKIYRTPFFVGLASVLLKLDMIGGLFSWLKVNYPA